MHCSSDPPRNAAWYSPGAPTTSFHTCGILSARFHPFPPKFGRHRLKPRRRHAVSRHANPSIPSLRAERARGIEAKCARTARTHAPERTAPRTVRDASKPVSTTVVVSCVKALKIWPHASDPQRASSARRGVMALRIVPRDGELRAGERTWLKGAPRNTQQRPKRDGAKLGATPEFVRRVRARNAWQRLEAAGPANGNGVHVSPRLHASVRPAGCRQLQPRAGRARRGPVAQQQRRQPAARPREPHRLHGRAD